MGLFGFGNKESVVDLAEKYRQQKEEDKIAEEGADVSGRSGNDFSDSDSVEERRRKLAKRILDMSKRMDDLSTKLYNLQQRIELLERKANVRLE